MAELNQKSDDSQLHWFWRLTTKWWFFPVFYVFLVVLLVIIWKIKGENENFIPLFFGLVITMPDGLLFFVELVQGPSNDRYLQLAAFFPFIFHIFLITSVSIIVYFKYKEGRVLRWIILPLLILLISSFIGCAIAGPNI
ncbi:hypothetical protein HYX05_05015 [Candidatus Woesearchaeota archaeon]|nr:hypothetical protein [Candidatus Woesearchaeota archaeon]